ncbi:MAG: formyltetrahydrofolate deformylase [Bacteroidota bacterium]|nr:formyltetrahydrofolate deformylase [Candidatus Kapabacteria bacterium]MDW8219124.1 formyltetrahydrofolate deformylase [Bacteroidota bacterium]
MRAAIILISCPDQKGIITAVTEFVYRHQGNIIDLDEHVDFDTGTFFMRIEWDMTSFTLSDDEIRTYFQRYLATPYQMNWSLYFSDVQPTIALFVSQYLHCLYDILARCESKEWDVKVPLIFGNHEIARPVAERFGAEFHLMHITKENKREQEQKQIALLKQHNVELIVLTRYMQTLSPEFVHEFPNRIINIHHSLLPAFVGAKPYHQAYERGVKIIGATSHYVTAELDAGPIIEQDVVRITHKDSIQDMIRKGRDVEKVILARAVRLHMQRKILVHGNKTVVFI